MTDKTTIDQGTMLEAVLIRGDLSKLTPAERMNYYEAVCKSTGLNPLTRPFEFIVLNGKLTLYCKRDATDQLRKRDGISITKLEQEQRGDIYIVTAHAQDKEGRTDSAIGAVNLGGLKGDALANAYMKAETKGKRRVTLSICGLGWLDETEIGTIPEAQPVTVDSSTGEIAGVAIDRIHQMGAIGDDVEIIIQGTGEIVKPTLDSIPGLMRGEAKPIDVQHWIDDEATRKRFFAWLGNINVTEEEVHQILGVARMHDYTGTKEDARKAILKWIADGIDKKA